MGKKSASLVRRPRRGPPTEMATGTTSTTNSCLGLSTKEIATPLRIRIFVWNCAYRFGGKYFSTINHKRSAGCHGRRLTVGS
jgi:hypothetical protein